MSPKLIDGLIYLTLIMVLLLVTHIAAVIIDKRNQQDKSDSQTQTNSLEGEN